MKKLIRPHPAYFVGFAVWICALVSILLFSRFVAKKKDCQGCDDYFRFVSSLPVDQKAKFAMLEAGAIKVGEEYFVVGESSSEEFELFKKQLIFYRQMEPVADEKTKRIVILNSILAQLPPGERDIVLKKKAAILYRNGGYVMIGDIKALDNLD
jgi:hypothetical protein